MADPTLFSDSQFAVLVAALATIGTALAGTLKWAASRIVKALDDNTVASREARDADIEAKAKLNEIHDWVQDHTPVDDGPHREQPPSRRERTRSNPHGTAIAGPGGYGPIRPKTQGG